MQIGLTAFVVALAASRSDEKSNGIDDATVHAGPSRQDVAGSRHRTVRNLNSFCTRGSATGHATPIIIREPTESFDILFPAWRSGEAQEPMLQCYANPACP